MKEYYTIFVYGDVEPELVGPFQNAGDRDNKALELRNENGPEHGIFWLNITDGHPTIGAYSAAFLEDDEE